MEEYRFSFETDEQYQGRVGQLEVQGVGPKEKTESKEPTPSLPVVAPATPSPSLTTVAETAAQPVPQHSSIKLVFPWWLTTAFLVVFIILFITAKRRNEVHVRLPRGPAPEAPKPRMSVDAVTGSRRYDSDAALPVWRVTKVPSTGS